MEPAQSLQRKRRPRTSHSADPGGPAGGKRGAQEVRRQGCLFRFSCNPAAGALDTHSSRPPCPHRTRDRCHLTPGFPLSVAGAGGPEGGNSWETPRNRQAEPRRSKWDGRAGRGGCRSSVPPPSPQHSTEEKGQPAPAILTAGPRSERSASSRRRRYRAKQRPRAPPEQSPHSAQAARHCACRTPPLPHPATGRLRCHRPRRPPRHPRTANQGGRGPAGRGD